MFRLYQEPKKEKLAEYKFKGQHAFAGGNTSCVVNVLEALGRFSQMSDNQFFDLWPPNEPLDSKQSSLALSKICEAGNQLHIQEQPPSIFSSFIYLPTNPYLFLEKVQLSKGNDHIKDLRILDEYQSHKCVKENLENTVIEQYKKHQEQLALKQDDLFFISLAAYHATAFFARTRPDNKTFYYVFDTSPSRAIGGDRYTGLFEVYSDLTSAINAVQSRWKWFSTYNVGELLTLSKQSRIDELLLKKFNSQKR